MKNDFEGKDINAIEGGNGVDFFELGLKYEKGMGCEKDYEKAAEASLRLATA